MTCCDSDVPETLLKGSYDAGGFPGALCGFRTNAVIILGGCINCHSLSGDYSRKSWKRALFELFTRLMWNDSERFRGYVAFCGDLVASSKFRWSKKVRTRRPAFSRFMAFFRRGDLGGFLSIGSKKFSERTVHSTVGRMGFRDSTGLGEYPSSIISLSRRF